MIFVDFNQVCISNIMQDIKNNSDIEENLVRHMILSSLLMYKQKFGPEYGELVICCDSPKSWRKDVFPFYKANRKSYRESSDFDWKKIFLILNKIRDELRESFPYRVIEVDGAEADDIIGQFSLNAKQPVLILSSDKDFIQLQSNPNVKQYSIIQKKYLNGINPDTYLKQHIIKGDRGDGIPNILSDDDTFVSEKRQNKLQKIKIESWIQMDPQEFCNDRMYRNYCRNEQLVSLHKTPSDIIDKIVDLYKNYKDNGRSKLFNYFVKHKLKNLMEHIQEF
jgi:hypothetical protein